MANGFLGNLIYSTKLKAGACLGLIVLADFLFYGELTGWTLGGFAAVFLTLFLLGNPLALRTAGGKLVAVLTSGQCLLLIDNPDLLSLMLYVSGMTTLAIISRGYICKNALVWFYAVGSFLFAALTKIDKDLQKYRKVTRQKRVPGAFERILRGWALPVIFTVAFIALFGSANPIITGWLDSINWQAIGQILKIKRIILWIFLAMIFWAFLRPRIKNAEPIRVCIRDDENILGWLFSREAVTRSLIIFNLLFAFQTIMDVLYLWGGATLPEGLTYAEYAQLGAYPLVFTALLSAAFVLVAMRPRSEIGESSLIRNLVFIWIAQNIFLVISSIWRTGLYIEEYSLTYLRLAALIWMGLVACGLVLIVLRIYYNKTNTWLINMNAAILVGVLYLSSSINVAGVIAHYNVRHNCLISGEGSCLDIVYLKELGPAALPAIHWLQQHDNIHLPRVALSNIESTLQNRLRKNISYWRSWTFQAYRLSGYKNSARLHNNRQYGPFPTSKGTSDNGMNDQ